MCNPSSRRIRLLNTGQVTKKVVNALGGGPLASSWQAAKLHRVADGDHSAQFRLCASGARSRIPVDRRLSVKEFEDIADQCPVFPVMPEQATRGSMPRSGLLVMAGRGVRL
jgi:hypothetical protein